MRWAQCASIIIAYIIYTRQKLLLSPHLTHSRREKQNKKRINTNFFFPFSIQCVDINESQWRDNHKKLYFFLSIYKRMYARMIIPNKKKIFSCEYIRSFELDAISIYQHICRTEKKMAKSKKDSQWILTVSSLCCFKW